MANLCKSCGAAINDGVKFCPACGAPAPKEKSGGRDYMSKITGLNNTKDTTAEFDAEDIAKNKTMAILAYILFLIPLFAAKDSKFARYHTNQGLLLAIAAAGYGIAYAILSFVLLAISWRLYFLVAILGFVGLVFAGLMAIGIINAAGGKARELPVIGKIRLLK